MNLTADESKVEMIPVQPRIVCDELICKKLTIWHNHKPRMRLYVDHEESARIDVFNSNVEENLEGICIQVGDESGCRIDIIGKNGDRKVSLTINQDTNGRMAIADSQFRVQTN